MIAARHPEIALRQHDSATSRRTCDDDCPAPPLTKSTACSPRATATSPRSSCRWPGATRRALDAEYLTVAHPRSPTRTAPAVAVRASLRLVSTPACRAARATSNGRFDEIDHVMTYFFTDKSGLKGFNALFDGVGGRGPEAASVAPGPAWRLLRAQQGGCATGQGRRGCAALVAGPRRVPVAGSGHHVRGRIFRTSTAWQGSGRPRHSRRIRASRVRRRGSRSPTASSTTTRLPRRTDYGLPSRRGGPMPASSRCWPHRFTPSSRTSGIAMSRKESGCVSA